MNVINVHGEKVKIKDRSEVFQCSDGLIGKVPNIIRRHRHYDVAAYTECCSSERGHWKKSTPFCACHCVSLGLSEASVRRILHKDLHFYPYKIQVTRVLHERDCVNKVNLEHWLQTARVKHSGDAQNGVDFFLWPLSLPQYCRVYVQFYATTLRL